MNSEHESTAQSHAFRIGGIDIVALSDGVLEVPAKNFPSADAGIVPALLGSKAKEASVPIAVNCFVLRLDGATVLIDAGCGSALRPRGGWMPQSLAAAGLSPRDIDVVVMSHLHLDHTGGLIDGDRDFFPEARVLVPQAELDYWLQDGFPDSAPMPQQRSAAIAAQVARIYGSRIESFNPGGKLFRNVRTIALPGHTPGHTGFVIGEGEDSLYLWSDIVHSAPLQIHDPDWHYVSDVDRDEAYRNRLRVFSECAAEARIVAGMHLPFPGTGRVYRDAKRFRFETIWLPGKASKGGSATIPSDSTPNCPSPPRT